MSGSEELAVRYFDAEAFDRHWQELVAPFGSEIPDYLTSHKRRYAELFRHMAGYLRDAKAPAVLEIGVSGFLPFYKKLFPEITLATIDRPAELFGTGVHYCVEVCGAGRHYNADLNAESLSPMWGTPPLGVFDYVICTEVIEHLVVNAVEFLRDVLSLLQLQGKLYLTTPNFLSHHHLQQVAAGDNPQPIFPRRGADRDAAHHYREYTLKELRQFAEAAGGCVLEAQYSDCWDGTEMRQGILTQFPEFKSNLVMVVGRGSHPGAGGDSKAARSTADRPEPTRKLIYLPYEVPPSTLAMDSEVQSLRDRVAGYERGRFIRFMRWLRDRR